MLKNMIGNWPETCLKSIKYVFSLLKIDIFQRVLLYKKTKQNEEVQPLTNQKGPKKIWVLKLKNVPAVGLPQNHEEKNQMVLRQ